MTVADQVPDSDVLLALEAEELGLQMLPALASMTCGGRPVELASFVQAALVGYPSVRRKQVQIALVEAWAWLEGSGLLVAAHEPNMMQPWPLGRKTLSRKARQLSQASDADRHSLFGRRLAKESLHPNIREDVWALYHRGKYDTAVFEAMKAVEVAVRRVGGFKDDVLGKALMQEAFKEGGPLTDPQAEKNEQVGRMNLFMGAISSYKNPHSHRNVALSNPEEAAEIIMLANHLLRIVDGRQTSRQ